MNTEGNEKKRRIKFSRAVLPPEKFHSSRKGLRGYSRAEEKRDAREEHEDLYEDVDSDGNE